MLTNKIDTIQEHQEKVGSRFQLAQIIMHRTKELMNGSPIKGIDIAKVGSEFNPKGRYEIPPHRFPKIALEELRQNKLTWNKLKETKVVTSDENEIVFGE